MRQFKVKVANLTLPGAGVAPGVISGRPFALAGEIVTERELGKHIVGLFDQQHDRTLGIIDEIDPVPESELPVDKAPFTLQEGQDLTVSGHGSGEGMTAPWESYPDETSTQVIERLRSATPQVVEKVKSYERVTAKRQDILDFVPTHTHDDAATRRGGDAEETEGA